MTFYTARQIRRHITREVTYAGNQVEWGLKRGINQTAVSRAVSHEPGEPIPSAILRVLKATPVPDGFVTELCIGSPRFVPVSEWQRDLQRRRAGRGTARLAADMGCSEDVLSALCSGPVTDDLLMQIGMRSEVLYGDMDCRDPDERYTRLGGLKVRAKADARRGQETEFVFDLQQAIKEFDVEPVRMVDTRPREDDVAIEKVGSLRSEERIMKMRKNSPERELEIAEVIKRLGIGAASAQVGESYRYCHNLAARMKLEYPLGKPGRKTRSKTEALPAPEPVASVAPVIERKVEDADVPPRKRHQKADLVLSLSSRMKPESIACMLGLSKKAVAKIIADGNIALVKSVAQAGPVVVSMPKPAAKVTAQPTRHPRHDEVVRLALSMRPMIAALLNLTVDEVNCILDGKSATMEAA